MKRASKMEIIGYYCGEHCLCPRCITREERRRVLDQENNLITSRDLESPYGWFYCDRCQIGLGAGGGTLRAERRSAP